MAPPKATEAKEKGNQAFKSGDYPAAIGHYTTAILADANDPTFPLNRAAAYLKLGKYQDAERDCNTVIKLSPKNPKAYYRRGQARRGLEKIDDALADFQKVSQLEPADHSANTEIQAIQVLQEQLKKPRMVRDLDCANTGPASTSSKGVHSKRRRIPIEIIEPQTEQEPSSSSPVTIATGPPKEGGLLEPVSTRSLSPQGKASKASNAPFSSPPQKLSAPSPAAKNDVPTTPAPARAGGGIFRSSGDHTLFNHDRPNGASKQTPSAAKPAGEPRPPPASTQPPMTLFQFTRSWDNNKGDRERWEILKAVPSSALPQLFKTSMEPAFLVSILQVFLSVAGPASEEERKEIREYMIALSRAQRFSTVLLLLSKEEKQLVKKVWDSLGNVRDKGYWNVA